jgi:hypothetical protein
VIVCEVLISSTIVCHQSLLTGRDKASLNESGGLSARGS